MGDERKREKGGRGEARRGRERASERHESQPTTEAVRRVLDRMPPWSFNDGSEVQSQRSNKVDS